MAGPWVLAIDTAGDACAVGLLGPGVALARRAAMAKGQAEALFPMIAAVLAEAGVGYDALGRIVVCTGPGMFTGVRIGVAAARGLALGTGAPAVGVSRFEAMATQAMAALPPGARVAVCLTGRGGGVDWQGFAGDQPLGPPEGMPPGGPGGGFDALAGSGAPADTRLPHLVPDDAVDPLVLARLGLDRELGARPAPLYLRGPDAELPRDPAPTVLAR